MGWMDRILYSTASAAVYRDPDDWPRDGGGSWDIGIDDVACVIFFVMSIKILHFIFTHPFQKPMDTSMALSFGITIALLVILPHEVLVDAGWVELLFVSTCKDPEGMTSVAKFVIGASAVMAVFTLLGILRFSIDTFGIIAIAGVAVVALAKIVREVLNGAERQAEESFQKKPLFTMLGGLRYYKGESNYLVWDGGNHVFSVADLSSAHIVRTCGNQTTIGFSDYIIQAEHPRRVLKNRERRTVEFMYDKGRDVFYLEKPRSDEVTSGYAMEALKKIYMVACQNPNSQ